MLRNITSLSTKRSIARYLSSQTAAVRSGHEFSLDAVRPTLSSFIPEEEPLTVTQFTHGQSNPTYILTSEATGKRWVLRKQPNGTLLRGAHAVDREYEILSKLRGRIPVPNVRVFQDDKTVLGTPFYVYDYVDAEFYKDCRFANARDHAHRRAMIDDMVKTAGDLHMVDYEDAGLGEYGKVGGYLKRQIKVWSSQFRATEDKEEPNPAMEYLMDFLPSALPSISDQTTIVHGDIRPDNMLFHPSGSVAAVVDWELSTLGHPGTDLALLTTPYHTPREMPILGGLMDSTDEELRQDGIPSEFEFVTSYVDTTGNSSVVSELDYHLAFASFRMASILQGVYSRAKKGNASSAEALKVGKLSGVIAGLGKRHAKRYEKNPGRLGSTASAGAARGMATRAGKTPEQIRDEVERFIEDEIIPVESEVLAKAYKGGEGSWEEHPILEELKIKAKEQGLWNLFLPDHSGLTNVEYATMAEKMGRSLIASEVFNCQAPDTGNMEVLHMFGTPAQQKEWLEPLMDGKIRSAFGMTEPMVASSDATNMESSITEDGDELILNGRKWWTSNGCHPNLAFYIFMGRDSSVTSDTPRHRQHSMVLVPKAAEGVETLRPLTVFGYDDAPHGHSEVVFDNVRVPKENVIGGIGEGFTIAQARLGPGRIHHCMRLIGMAERCLEQAVKRADERVAFGKPLSEFQSNQTYFAQSRIDIDMARLLVLNAAKKVDEGGAKLAKQEIAQIKVVCPAMASRVADGAMQIHGGAGLSHDFPMAHMFAWARVLRLADGPDEVHLQGIARDELKSQRKKRK